MDEEKQAEVWSRLDNVLDEIAQGNNAGVQKHQMDDGTWVMSIELVGDRQGEWAVSASGATEIEAMSNLIQNAKRDGIA
jgi:hypothetical protein